ncbi:thioredoxin [Paludifilum halophilum]|nr:thioredoxin [Paludifilum halophilum]
MVQSITEENYNEWVRHAEKPVVLEFGADW